MSKPDPDNPEWTKEDFARARPASEVLPQAAVSALTKNRGGRPSSGKQAISIRLDADVIAKFKATGPGWQSRINETLRRANP